MVAKVVKSSGIRFYIFIKLFSASLMLGCVKMKSRKNVYSCPVFIALFF